jgi:hypothetical protein
VREVEGDAGSVHVAVGEPESIVTVDADAAADGPWLEAESDTEFDANLAITVPSDAHVTDTVTDDPDEPDGENTQPVAVPTFEKSAAAMPDTDSLKANVYDNVREFDGDAGAVHVAVGGVASVENAVFRNTPLA